MVALLAGTLTAQDKEKAERAPRAFGQVKSVDAAAKKIVVNARLGREGEPQDMTFVINDETKITEGREAAEKALADLKEGTTVSVTFEKADDGTMTAKQIRIMPAREGKAKEKKVDE
jgi:Cu/Ag efflux protein CusF